MSTWYLDDLAESFDVKEDENDVVWVRRHIVIQIHILIKANVPPNVLEIGEQRSSITYMVGGLWRQNNPAGSGLFLCVGDGIRPVQNPLDYVSRQQTWEYFGPWVRAPAGWGV